jgi:hypothetical protein
MNRYNRTGRDEGLSYRYSVWRLVINIIILALPPAVAFWGFFGLWSGSIAVLYLSGVLLYILIVGPWVTCTHCTYFGRTCPFGLGLLSAATYSIGSGNFETGERLRKFFWLFWYTLLPTISYLFYLITGFTANKLVYFIAFLITLGLFWINALVYYIAGREKGVCLLLSTGTDHSKI